MFIKISVLIIFCFIFWFICFKNTGTDEKNMLGFRSYPREVQEKVYQDERLVKLVPKEINLPKIIVSNIILFTVVFLLIGAIIKYTIGFNGFADCLIYFIALGQVLNLFDLVVIDLLWWRNTKRIRFSCVSEKEYYQNPKKHIDSFLRGIPTFFVSALIVAGILSLLP